MAFDKVIDSVQLDNDIKSVADAIRAKGGTSEQLTFPTGFNTAIENIKGGGGGGYEPTPEELTYTGDCSKKFAGGDFDWLIKNYGNKITTKDVSNMSQMFKNSNIDIIPFSINGVPNREYDDDKEMFMSSGISQIPTMSHISTRDVSRFFWGCDNITSIDEDLVDTYFDWDIMDKATSPFVGKFNEFIYGLLRIRKLPMKLLAHGNPIMTNSYWIGNQSFIGFYLLDEIKNVPNAYYNAEIYGLDIQIDACYRLKDFTFSPTMTNGQPNNPKWESSTITFSKTGYSYYKDLTQYGIPDGKEIVDDATYQQLKNDKDSWTQLKEYSRYNHDSAVRTINSLPDTSAFVASTGRGNNIKFEGVCGSKTDGGAVNTLTPEEIAVATAKGWTVAFQ